MKAFIFDMDGVIIDSEPIYLEINKKTLHHFLKRMLFMQGWKHIFLALY